MGDILAPFDRAHITGPGVAFCLEVARAARGGQVVLSQAAWEAVKPVVTQHPGAVQAVSLGAHRLSKAYPGRAVLMEVRVVGGMGDEEAGQERGRLVLFRPSRSRRRVCVPARSLRAIAATALVTNARLLFHPSPCTPPPFALRR